VNTDIFDNDTVAEVVYFLRAGDYIKIGKATGHPRSRIAQLQTGCPFKIDLVGFIFGGRAREAKLHAQFSHLRTFGEWFLADAELERCIEALLDSQRERMIADIEAMRREIALLSEIDRMQAETIAGLRLLAGKAVSE
jgi:hypothetical protein